MDRVIGGRTVESIVTIPSGRNFKLEGGSNTYNYSNLGLEQGRTLTIPVWC